MARTGATREGEADAFTGEIPEGGAVGLGSGVGMMAKQNSGTII